MGIRDAELEFEVNDTYWLDELDADLERLLLEDTDDDDLWLDEDDWAIGDDDVEPYDESEYYADFEDTDWEVDLLSEI